MTKPMSKIEVLTCASCGSSLSPKAMKCEFCDNLNIITKESNPLKLNPLLSKQYLANEQLSKDFFNSGLLHINLKNYEIAKKLLEKEIENNPVNADAYYYYAISIINGKRIKSLGYSDIKMIVQLLNSAMQLEDNAKFYFLLAIINYDFFEGNGMIVPEPNYSSLLEKTIELKLENDDVTFLQSNIFIPKNELFNQLTNN